MTGRFLSLTGNGGDYEFDSPSTWENSLGHVAKYAPDREDTVSLYGSGTLYGSGAVAVMAVSGTFVAYEGTIVTGTLLDTGAFGIGQDETIRARTISVLGNQFSQVQSGLEVGNGGTLSAAGAALDITVNFAENTDVPYAFLIYGGLVSLGAGQLDIGSVSGDDGALTIESGTLIAGAGSTISIGLDGGVGGALLDGTLVSEGIIDIGTGSGSVGQVDVEGGIVLAARLNIGVGGEATISLTDANLTLSGHNGVGLVLASGPGGNGIARMQTSNGTIVVAGRTEIGLAGEATVDIGSASILNTGDGLYIGGVQQGGGSGFGSFTIDQGGLWRDTGVVQVVRGSLSLLFNSGVDTIAGSLELGSRDGNSNTFVKVSASNLDISGTLAIHAEDYGQSNTVTIDYGSLVQMAGLSIGAGDNNVVIDGTSPDGTPTALDTASLSLGVDASISVQNRAMLQVGTNQDVTSAYIGGKFVLGSATADVTGSVFVTGDLEVLGGNVNVTAAGTALQCNNGQIYVQQGTLAAAGGLALAGQAILTIDDYGTLTASSGVGSDALVIGRESVFSDDQATVVLAGNSTIYGSLEISGATITDTATITAAGASVSGYGTLAAALLISGQTQVQGGLTVSGAVSGTGTLELSGQLTLLGAVANPAEVDFANIGTLTIGDVAGFDGTIGGWAAGDTIALLGVAATSDKVSGQTLSLYDGDDHVVARLHFGGSINAGEFMLQQTQGNTVLTFPS